MIGEVKDVNKGSKMEGKLSEEQRKLVEDNYALTYYMLKCLGLSKSPMFDDYQGAAALGLCKAAKTYDPSAGVKFGTYATTCIANECLMLKRQLHKANIKGFTVMSLDVPVSDDGDSKCYADLIDSGIDIERDFEVSELVKLAMQKLEDKYVQSRRPGSCDKLEVFRQVCIRRINQKDVTERFGITQPYVSRIVAAVKRDLAEILKQEGLDV